MYALCQGQLTIENPQQPMVGVIHGGCQLEADIVTPSPSQAFVFVEEHEDSITRGNFICGEGWYTLPASRHGGAGTFSFADGHVEIKRWLDARTILPVKRMVGWFLGSQPGNRDVLWMEERATSKKPEAP